MTHRSISPSPPFSPFSPLFSPPSLPPLLSPLCSPPLLSLSLPSLHQWLHAEGSQGAPQSWRYGVPHCSVMVGEVEVHRSLRREWSPPPGTTNTLYHTTARHTSQNSLARRYTCTYIQVYIRIYVDTVVSGELVWPARPYFESSNCCRV